jgi:hypothetical protein
VAAAVGALVALAAVPSLAGAPRRQPIDAVRLDRIEANFDLLAGVDVARYRLVTPTGVERGGYEHYLLGQRLGVRSAGSFWHPRLWTWQANAEVLFLEDLVRRSSGTADLGVVSARLADSYVVAPVFDVSSQLLSRTQVPASFYVRRRAMPVRQVFLPVVAESTLEAGMRADWKNEAFPLEVTYQFALRDADIQSQGGVGKSVFVATDSAKHAFHARGRSVDRRHPVEGSYDLVDYSNLDLAAAAWQTQTGHLRHTAYLDPSARESRVTSSATAQRLDTLRVLQDSVRLGEQLHWVLTPGLSLDIDYALGWHRVNVEEQLYNRGALTLEWVLYRSLVMTASGFAQHTRLDEGELVTGGGTGAITYRKRLHRHLRMEHFYRVDRRVSSYHGPATVNFVEGERRELVGELPVALGQAGVDPTTVQVGDANRTQIYLVDRDFVVLTIGPQSFLQRLAAGAIPDGATVIVSYGYRLAEVARGDGTTHEYAGRLELINLGQMSAYAGYRVRDQRLDTFREQSHEVSVGARAGAGPINGAAEYRYVSNRLFDGHHAIIGVNAHPTLSPGFTPDFGLQYIYSELSYDGERRHHLRFDTSARVPFAGSFWARWRGAYIFEVGGASDGHTILGEAAIEWHLRKVLVWLEYKVNQRVTEVLQDGIHSVMFNVRRTF